MNCRSATPHSALFIRHPVSSHIDARVQDEPNSGPDARVQDEPDSGPPSTSQDPSSISNGALNLSGTVRCEGVKGKVKEHTERPEMSDIITEGLKKQTEGMGR